MKKIISVFLLVLLSISNIYAVSAKSAVVLDFDTLEVMYGKNENERMSMASTTKIMTAIVALENNDIDREVVIKKEYTNIEGSSMYLTEGETVSIRDLIYGLMLMSGNDSAVALAYETTGNYDEFIALMNDKAEQLGLENTSFCNPNGLDEDNHYTTALELAKLTSYALENEAFKEIVSSKYYKTEERTMKNHNKLLWLEEDAIGVKTGFTKKSGRCLVSAVEQNGKTLVAVTLNAPSDWNDHINMYEQAFSKYDRYAYHIEGEKYKEIAVEGGQKNEVSVEFEEDVNLSLTQNQRQNLQEKVIAKKINYAPIKKGEIFGEIVYNINDKEIYTAKLVYSDDVNLEYIEEMNLFEKFIDFLKNLFY